MKNKFLLNLILFWAVLSGGVIYAQTISGTVTDANGPLPQVNVNVKGSTVSTVTDFDGKFTLTGTGQNAILVFSYLGYVSKEVNTNGSTDITVVLSEDSQKLDEVIITGYVGQKKNSISGAVSQVDLEDLARTRVPDVTQALQGQVAGVFVAASTGAPGDGISLRIRGQGTIGNNDALYVVDGVPTRDITFLSNSDIKNITVLKDAASAAIYGSRAAGGVVLITTKRGSAGKTTFDVDVFTGVHFAQNLPKMLNTQQYLAVKDQAWHNSLGNAEDAVSPYAFDRDNRKDLSDTNWQDALFTTGESQSVQVSVSGATDKVQYLISGGYYGIDGIVVENNDKYKRVNFRSNINANVSDRFTVGTNLQISNVKQDRLSSSGDVPGVIRQALIRPPVIAVFKNPITDPFYTSEDPYTDLPFYNGYNQGWSKIYEYSSNPLAIVHFTDDTRTTFRTFGNVYAEYALLADKSLKFRSNLGTDISFQHNKVFSQNYGDRNLALTENYYQYGRNNRPNALNENRGERSSFIWSNTLNYVKTFGENHSLNALLGTEFIKNKQSSIGGARSLFDNETDAYRFLDFGGFGSATTPYPYSSGTEVRSTLLSYFASATYGFKEKYFLTATARADASSRFGPNNKWGYFPSVAANWMVSNEEFLKNVNWLSNLKLRASWGQNGNQEYVDGAYQTLVTSTINGPQIIRYGNDDLKWEATTQTNFGIDLGIIDNKLSFSVDYFTKNTSDILLSQALPGVSVGQIQSTFINAGEVHNKGFEFALNLQNNDHEFKYGVTANLATLKNEVVKLAPNVRLIEDSFSNTRIAVGQPINSYYGYEFVGIYQNQDEINSYLYSDAGNRVPGDMKFRDVNNDGKINADDRKFIGSPIPDLTYGLVFNASYKNFDIAFLFQGVEGVDRYNDLKQILNYDTRPFNSTTDVLQSWNGEGTSNTIPRLTFNNNGGSEISSTFVEDASYLRLKNVEIGYTLSKKSFPSLDNVRIYISGQNLLTWTDYTGLDPESTLLKDQGTYPQSASVMIGARIKL